MNIGDNPEITNLECLVTLAPNLKRLDIKRVEVTDFSVLEKLQELTELIADHTSIGASLAVLSSLKKLQILSLEGVVSNDFELLGSLTSLESLNLSESTVSDLSIELPKLHTLILTSTRVKDLSWTKSFPALIRIYLAHSYVEPQDLISLEKVSFLTEISVDRVPYLEHTRD